MIMAWYMYRSVSGFAAHGYFTLCGCVDRSTHAAADEPDDAHLHAEPGTRPARMSMAAREALAAENAAGNGNNTNNAPPPHHVRQASLQRQHQRPSSQQQRSSGSTGSGTGTGTGTGSSQPVIVVAALPAPAPATPPLEPLIAPSLKPEERTPLPPIQAAAYTLA
jgi:hypothetical protein